MVTIWSPNGPLTGDSFNFSVIHDPVISVNPMSKDSLKVKGLEFLMKSLTSGGKCISGRLQPFTMHLLLSTQIISKKHSHRIFLEWFRIQN